MISPQVNAAVLKLDCCKDPGQVSKSSLKQHFTKSHSHDITLLFSINVITQLIWQNFHDSNFFSNFEFFFP